MRNLRALGLSDSETGHLYRDVSSGVREENGKGGLYHMHLLLMEAVIVLHAKAGVPKVGSLEPKGSAGPSSGFREPLISFLWFRIN